MAKDSGVVNIHGKEYKTVAARVNEFREKYSDKYGLPTEIYSIDADVVVMKASVVRLEDDKVVATGYAEEKRAASQINKTSALENCETSAIGRALANFGLAGTEYASADEVAQAMNQQKAAQRPAVSPEKLKLIREAGKEKGLSDSVVEARIRTLKTDEDANVAYQNLRLLGRD